MEGRGRIAVLWLCGSVAVRFCDVLSPLLSPLPLPLPFE